VPVLLMLCSRAGAIATSPIRTRPVIYDLLFKVSAETLITIAADPKHLGAASASRASMHTWGRRSPITRIVHMIVPGRRHLIGRLAMGVLPARLLPAGTCALTPVRRLFGAAQPQHTNSSSSSASTLRSPMHRRSRHIWRRCARPSGWSTQSARSRSAAVLAYLALHPPRRHLQQPLDRLQPARRHLQVEGLSDRRPIDTSA